MYRRIDSNGKRCLIYILREKWGILTWVPQEVNLTVDDLCVIILLGMQSQESEVRDRVSEVGKKGESAGGKGIIDHVTAK